MVLFMAAKCPKDEMAAYQKSAQKIIPDNYRRQSLGNDIARSPVNTEDSRCRKIDDRAQNIFIQWGRDRKLEGQPVDMDLASKMLAVSSWESGGKVGLGITNITPHGRERVSGAPNMAGYDGETKSYVRDFESYVNNPSKRKYIDHQMNFGLGQISPDVFSNYSDTLVRLKEFASTDNPDQLFSKCISDIGYASEDHGEVKNHLNTLISRRDEIESWVETVRRSSTKYGSGAANEARGRRDCNNSSDCVEASVNLGRWLTYCPRLNIETKEIVYTQNKAYYSHKTRKAPPVCEETLRAEVDKFNYTNPQFYYVDNGRYGADPMIHQAGI
jgi:hypothetical protein